MGRASERVRGALTLRPLDDVKEASTRKRRILPIVVALSVGLVIILLAGAWWAYSAGYYHAMRGGIAQDEGQIDEAIRFFSEAYDRNPNAFMVSHDLACCYALKGDQDACIEWLARALKSSYGEYAREWAKTERDFDSVRQSAAFRSLVFDEER